VAVSSSVHAWTVRLSPPTCVPFVGQNTVRAGGVLSVWCRRCVGNCGGLVPRQIDGSNRDQVGGGSWRRPHRDVQANPPVGRVEGVPKIREVQPLGHDRAVATRSAAIASSTVTLPPQGPVGNAGGVNEGREPVKLPGFVTIRVRGVLSLTRLSVCQVWVALVAMPASPPSPRTRRPWRGNPDVGQAG